MSERLKSLLEEYKKKRIPIGVGYEDFSFLQVEYYHRNGGRDCFDCKLYYRASREQMIKHARLDKRSEMRKAALDIMKDLDRAPWCVQYRVDAEKCADGYFTTYEFSIDTLLPSPETP